MKEVTYLKNNKGGKWVLLSLIGPLETDKDKAIRLKNERQMRDWYSLHFNKASQQFRESFDSVSMAFDDKGEF